MKELIDRFLKDIGLSMHYNDIGDMRQKLKLYDKCFKTDYTVQYDDFAYNVSTKYDDPQAYLAEYRNIKENAISDIKSRAVFAQFLQDELKTPVHCVIPEADSSIYALKNDGEVFISIDMRKANFSSLRYYGVFSEDSWEEFLSKFTSDKHILNSKYIRQVILGNCNPKRQIQLEKSIISQLFFEIRHGGTGLVDLFATGFIALAAMSVDEVVIKINDLRGIPTVLQAVLEAFDDFKTRLGFDGFRVEVFKLHALTEQIYIYDDSTTERLTHNNPAVLGYVRQFYDKDMPTSKWDCKCLDNVRLYILAAQSLGMAMPMELFSINTQYGPAVLQRITMPDFNWDLLKVGNTESKTSVFG